MESRQTNAFRFVVTFFFSLLPVSFFSFLPTSIQKWQNVENLVTTSRFRLEWHARDSQTYGRFFQQFLVYSSHNHRGMESKCQFQYWATDGIGLSFAKQLAAQGQNIVLISRSCEKLERVARKIKEAYGVDTRIIVADFSSTDIYDRISSGLEGLNLGTLVNPIIHRLFRRSYYTGEGGSN